MKNTSNPPAKVLITGASRGIGKACANLFAAHGYDLYLCCHANSDLLLKLANELMDNYNITCQTFVGDISDPRFVQTMFRSISSLDILINNAGQSYLGLLQDMSPEEWNRIIAVNLNSCFLTCKSAIPLMLASGQGRIINVSSIWGSTGGSMEVAYSASKGGVNSFTRALAKELAPSNIQVNAAAFGMIETDMNSHFSSEDLSLIRSEIPADRIGSPEEAADLILQLAQSPTYLTGQIITMDGGWT